MRNTYKIIKGIFLSLMFVLLAVLIFALEGIFYLNTDKNKVIVSEMFQANASDGLRSINVSSQTIVKDVLTSNDVQKNNSEINSGSLSADVLNRPVLL